MRSLGDDIAYCNEGDHWVGVELIVEERSGGRYNQVDSRCCNDCREERIKERSALENIYKRHAKAWGVGFPLAKDQWLMTYRNFVDAITVIMGGEKIHKG